MKRYELDTIGQIYGAIISKTWSPTFRMQAMLHETITPELLQQAADDLRIRFPYIFVALRKGSCSYYLEENDEPLKIKHDSEGILAYYGMDKAAHHCFRILYGEKHIALEVLHTLTDGHGARIILLTLVHRYLELKHDLPEVPANIQNDLVYSLKDRPSDEETGNAYAKNAGKNPVDLKEPKPYKLQGTLLPSDQKIITIGTINSKPLIAQAHHYGATVTTFLATIMAEVVNDLQNKTPNQKKQPIAIGIPVNVREILASKTMRNYTAQKNLTLRPEQLDFSLEQKCNLMGLQLKDFRQDKDLVRNLTAAYVAPLENPLAKYTPCVIKNRLISYLYTKEADAVMSTQISNLGDTDLPEEMRPFIDSVYFILGKEKALPNTCSAISCNGKTNISFTRYIQESTFEDEFFRRLRELGLNVEIQDPSK